MREDTRLPSSQRGYDGKWRRLRALKLKRNPLCEECERLGRVVPATMVHHIVPIEQDPTLRLVWSNLMSLCEACHDVKHSSEAKQVKGCDVSGFPTSEGHPWNQGGKPA